MFSGIDFLLQRTMSSFFIAIKNLLTAYHIDKQSTGKIIEPLKLGLSTRPDIAYAATHKELGYFLTIEGVLILFCNTEELA